MKKSILSSVLAVSFLLPSLSFASDYYCKDAYEKKLERIENNRVSREIALGSMGLSIIVAGVAVPLIVFSGGGAGIAILSALVTGPSSQALRDLLDREEGLLLAKSFIEMSQTDREVLKEKAYSDFLSVKLKDANSNTQIVTTIDQVRTAYPYSEFEMTSIIDSTLVTINKKRSRKNMNELSYSEFQDLIKTELEKETFCSKRAETFRKVFKLLKKVSLDK